MELGQLRHFLAVIESGSLSDAARRLRLSQGALSKSIQVLESSVGTPLFERSKRGMIQTSFGKALEIHARAICAEAAHAQDELDLLSKGKSGRVAFGIGTASAAAILPNTVRHFYRTHPQVQLDIREGFYRDILPMVATGELEFAIFMAASEIHVSHLVSEVLLPRQRVVVVTSAKNPIAAHGKATLQDIWPGPWIFPKGEEGSRAWLIDAFRKIGLPAPVSVIEISAGTIVTKLIEANPLFLFTAPELKVRDDVEAGILKIVQLDGPHCERTLSVYFREGAFMTPVAASLLESVRAVCAALAGD